MVELLLQLQLYCESRNRNPRRVSRPSSHATKVVGVVLVHQR